MTLVREFRSDKLHDDTLKWRWGRSTGGIGNTSSDLSYNPITSRQPMTQLRVPLFLTCLLLALSGICQNVRETGRLTAPATTLIPEGIAYDSVTQTVFVSSIAERKIIKFDADG